MILLLSVSVLSSQAIPAPVRAASTAELSPSNGATVCAMYFTGPGVAQTVWNATSSTCTVTAQHNVGPTVCISSSPGGCTGNATDDLIIDSGVTVVMQGAGSQIADMCVYSTLENHGTIVGGSFCDYGTIINYGTIKIPRGNYFMTLPDNGFGILDNRQSGEIANDYNFIDAGTVINNGTFYNHGQFGNDNQYNSTFANQGTFVGSSPCFSFDGCRTWLGIYNVTSGTVINQLGNGVMLTITGASGSNVAVISQNQTTTAPMGLGSLNISSALFYDVMINGISTGTALLCIADSHASEGMTGGMQYWNGTDWAFAGNQTVLQMTQTHILNGTSSTVTSSILTLCGDIPVADLAGTPIGVGTPLGTSQQTTSTTSSSSAATIQSRASTTLPSNSSIARTTGSSSTSSSTSSSRSSTSTTTTPNLTIYLVTGVAIVAVAGLAWYSVIRRKKPV